MKSVLISIRPRWCELIANGEKTIEVRKTRTKIETPFKCYIYCTKDAKDTDRLWILNEQRRTEYGGLAAVCANLEENPAAHRIGNGQVIGEFVCDEIFPIRVFENGTIQDYMFHRMEKSCVPYEDIANYIGNDRGGYGWHISDLKIYDKPRELSEFFTADKEAIRQCENRKQSYYAFTDTGYIKNGFYCKKKDDWCFGGCKRKVLTRPPQSWCYVEELP